MSPMGEPLCNNFSRVVEKVSANSIERRWTFVCSKGYCVRHEKVHLSENPGGALEINPLNVYPLSQVANSNCDSPIGNISDES